MRAASGPPPPRFALLRVTLFPFELLEGLAAPAAIRALDRVLEAETELARTADALEGALFNAAGPPEPGAGPAAGRSRLPVLALRRAVHNRRPLAGAARAEASERIPPETEAALDAYTRELAALEDRRAAYRSAHARGERAGWEALLRIAADPRFAEGIFLAGRDLDRARRTALARGAGALRAGDLFTLSKLAAYLGRAATKTSPQGVFCATAPVSVGDAPLRVAGENGPERLEILFNVFEARKAVAVLAASPEMEAGVAPRPNPTLRRTGDGYAYWRPASLRAPEDDEVLTRVGAHPVLDALIAAAEGGRLGVAGLLERTARETGVDGESLRGFYDRLVEAGILIAEVEIPYDEPRPLAALARRVGSPPAGARAEELLALEARLAEAAALPPGERVHALDAAGEALEALPHVRPPERDRALRVDAASGFRVGIPRAWVEEVGDAVELYARFFAAAYPAAPGGGYAERFLERFPAGLEVPLLDLYHGVFEPEARMRPAALPDPESVESGKGAGAFTRVRAFLAARAAEAGEAREAALDPGAFLAAVGPVAPPRWAAGALFQVGVESVEAAAGRETRFYLNALFNGVGLALSRFHRLHAAELGEAVPALIRGAWERIAPPGAVPAELTYSHWGPTANASLRPRVFAHEIELPGDRASEGAAVIPLADLTVRYDPERARFTVRSRTLGREVVPVLSSGVEPEGLVSFLVRVGLQDLQPLAYFPGFDLPGMVHWPRFTVGRVALFRERWVFGASDLPAPGGGERRAAGADILESVHRWRRRHRLPRRAFASTVRNPKPFFVDLESPAFAGLLVRALAPGEDGLAPRLTLTEMAPGPDALWLRDRLGRYASEFLVQLEGGRAPAGAGTGGSLPEEIDGDATP